MALGEFDLLDGKNSFRGEEGLKCFVCDGYIQRDHRHRIAAPLATAEMKRTDVYALLAENCTNPTNHAWDIAIVHHQHAPARGRLNAKVVDLRDAALAFAGSDSENRT